MPQNSVDLVNIFQTVTQALVDNQHTLNQADTYNQDHGSNMVQTFQTITDALQNKPGSSASTALAYAAKKLSQSATSGSSQLYAKNLTQAATQFKGKQVDAQGAMQMLQTLIGSSQAGQPAGGQSGGGDMLGTLLGGLTGGETPAQGSSSSAGGGDMLGALLGGLTGGGSSSGAQGGPGLQNLLSAGMAFLQAKQGGQDNIQALVHAFTAGSGMGDASHRNQSTQLVVQSFLQALSSQGSG